MSRLGDVGATLAVLVCRLALALVISLALLAVGPTLLGHASTLVMSDSMAPGIRAGDVVAVRPMPARNIRAGMVVLVDDPSFPGRLRLHRVAQRTSGGFVLKGDANAQRDPTPVSAAAVHGVGYLRVPYIGLPLLWLRSGQPLLAALAVGGLLTAAAIVALLDTTTGSTTAQVLRRIARTAGKRRRLAAVSVVGLLVVAPTLRAPLTIGRSSWASFVGTTTSPSNAFTTGTWCPALPKPVVTGATTGSVPDIANSFAGTGTAERNLGALGLPYGSTYGATLSTANLRVSGTCTPGNTPNLYFNGGETVLSNATYAPNTSATESLWFNPSTAAGVLFDLGSATANASTAERQLYFTTTGGLAFAVRNGSTPVSCSVTSTVTLNTWHFAAVVFNSSTSSFTLYYDGASTSCTGTFTTPPPSTPSLYGRLGNDATFAPDAAGGNYTGSVDEVYTWSATMPASSITTIYNGGH